MLRSLMSAAVHPPRCTPSQVDVHTMLLATVLQYCRRKGVPVIINDRVDVALAAGEIGLQPHALEIGLQPHAPLDELARHTICLMQAVSYQLSVNLSSVQGLSRRIRWVVNKTTFGSL